jgi:hypothetical protein
VGVLMCVSAGGVCNGCDGLVGLNVSVRDCECNGCDGLLELTCERRTVDIMVVMVCWS